MKISGSDWGLLLVSWCSLRTLAIRRCHREIGGGAAELRLLRKEAIKED